MSQEKPEEQLEQEAKILEKVQPTGIKILAFLLAGLGIVFIVGGALSIATNITIITGIILLIAGIASLPLSYLLYIGNNIGRIVATVVYGAGLVTFWVDFGISQNVNYLATPLVATALVIVITYYLWFSISVNRFFREPA
ncbi:MAG: hypothetical protein GF308_08010 [Candidatus Heimdallarchaeota archaeon]|nr:hypothetical protein [Candidatus Heimdallarchaeota archaeon]